uniref:Titin n=1 Tax=Seriola lalandi dorsalis TaxID=1841481 RepID=A0A3B4WRR7_SERLL
TFEIPLTGRPMPKVTMSRNNVVIKGSKRLLTEVTPDSLIITLNESISSDAVCLKWAPSEYDGGSPVTNYVVLKRETSTPTWAEVSTSIARSAIKVTKLTKGEEYQFRIKAQNRYGVSDYIDSKSVMIKLPYSKSEEAQIDSDVAMRTHYIVKAGKDVELSVPLKGRPAPTASWSKGEECIDRNPKYEFHHSDTTTVLVMREVTRLDTGKYTVKIENGVGEPKTLTLSVKVQDTPAQCRNLVLKDVTRGKVTLCWEPPLVDGGAEITNYIVEKRDSSKRSYSAVTSKCTDTTYTIEDLSEKTSFFFRVLAENENGVGDPCDTLEPVKATETPGPAKEVSMKDSSKTSVTLQWLKPDYDGGSIISDYVIEKKLKDEEWSLGGTSRQCEFEVKKLKEHSNMFFRVAARNEKGQGDFVEIGPIKVIDYIITPEACLAEYPDGSISVRLGHNVHIELPYKGKPRPAILWLKDNLPLKESDQIRFKKTENKATLMIKNTKEILILISCLISYLFLVNTNIALIYLNCFPPATPDAPGTPDATEVTGESITLSWAPPTSDGGNPIQYYIIEKREKKTVRFYKVITKKPIVECAHKVLHLTEDMEYEFRVMAVNDAGVGAPSNISMPIKAAEPKDIPCAPSVVCVSDSTNTSISLEWSRPADDGGMDILGYIIEMVKGEETEWKRVNEELVAETHYVAAGLETGAEYKFRIAGVNHVGRGDEKETPEPTQAVDRLTPPQVDIDATFKQTHIVKAGGSVCLGINFRGKPIPTATWIKEEGELGVMTEIITTDGYSSLCIENCSRTDTGKYTVNLENASGSKAITFTVKVMDAPGAPQDVAFMEVSRGTVTLTWKPPLNDGGARIHHYIVERREASRRTWQQSGGKCTQHILRIQDLLEGVPYFFRVSAENQHGIGEAFELTEPVIATAEPASPKRMDILDTTDSSVLLGWLKPEHDGGSRIQCYVIEAKPKGTDKWVVVGNTKNLTYAVEKLNKGDEYDFRVKAKNEADFIECKYISFSKGVLYFQEIVS